MLASQYSLLKMKNLKVLLVDDSEDDRVLLEGSLRKIGLSQFEHAEDGVRALSLSERVPDLILMDTDMPYLEGPNACKEIRKRKYGNKIAIIGVSLAKEEKLEEVAKRWQESGADKFFNKLDYQNIPYLRQTIEEALRERGYLIPTASR